MTELPARVCVKIYAAEPDDASIEMELVRVLHDWIREGSSEFVFIDVADYTHVPDGPGVMLVTHDTTFALDRSDGSFGLHAQLRRSISEDPAESIAHTLRGALAVMQRLETDERLRERLKFRREQIRVESNDRLRAPNSDAAYVDFEPHVRRGVERVYPHGVVATSRVRNDPRDRLAASVQINSPQ